MWFTDNPWPPMLITGSAAVICLVLWNSQRRRQFLNAGLLFLLMTGGIYAMERAIVTEGERLQQDTIQLCQQFRARDDKALDHFSATAPEWKTMCAGAMATVKIKDDLRLSDFRTKVSNHNSRGTVHFRAHATISTMEYTGYHLFRCILTYQKEGGEWKIVDVERLDPIRGERMGVMDRR